MPGAGVYFARLFLSNHERQKTHNPGSLDRARNFALVLGADGQLLARGDLRGRRCVALQKLGVLPINLFDIRFAEETFSHTKSKIKNQKSKFRSIVKVFCRKTLTL